MNLQSSIAFVTGGASGLGESVVRMMADAGGRAAIFDLADSRGPELVRELGDAVAFFETDVSDPSQVERGVDAAVERFGRVNVLVNCAGISPGVRTLDRKRQMHSLDVFRRVVEVNLLGTFDMVRQTARHMARNDAGDDGERGLIVNVASIAGIEGQVGQTAYAASKGGVISLTLPLARDLAIWGIRVMTVAPGIMDTAMLAGLDARRREALLEVHVFPKRLGTPGDFAQVVRLFMENTLLNGDVLRLDAAARLS